MSDPAPLLEFPCATCAGSLFVLPPETTVGAFECPCCRRRTWARREGALLSIASEERLQRIVIFLRQRRWACPDHAHSTIEVVGIETLPADWTRGTLHYRCVRRRGWFRQRVHTGDIPLDILAFEADMLAHTPAPAGHAR